MTSIPSAIASLLYDHDTVIVPGLGAFVRHDLSAHVNVITNEFQRPSSSLDFDPQQREENTLVSDYLMACDGLTDEEARTTVATFVSDCFAQLKASGSTTIPSIGTLTMDEQQNLAFEPDEVNFNSDAFGLEDFNPQPVFGTATGQGTGDSGHETRDTARVTLDAGHGSRDAGITLEPADDDTHHCAWWIWLLLLLLIAGGAVLWYVKYRPVPTQPWVVKPLPVREISGGPIHLRPLCDTLENPVDTISAEPEPVIEPVTESVTEPVTEQPVTEQPVTEPVTEPVTKPVVNPVNETTPVAPSTYGAIEVITPPAEAKAFIVGGCFTIEKNALNMTADFRQQGCAEAFVMKRGTRYYVCYGHYASTAEAKAALPDILKNYNDKAWIMKK